MVLRFRLLCSDVSPNCPEPAGQTSGQGWTVGWCTQTGVRLHGTNDRCLTDAGVVVALRPAGVGGPARAAGDCCGGAAA